MSCRSKFLGTTSSVPCPDMEKYLSSTICNQKNNKTYFNLYPGLLLKKEQKTSLLPSYTCTKDEQIYKALIRQRIAQTLYFLAYHGSVGIDFALPIRLAEAPEKKLDLRQEMAKHPTLGAKINSQKEA